MRYRFNPLAGIRCFLISPEIQMPTCRTVRRFNPLAGIRCFLTRLMALSALDKIDPVSIPLRGFVVF